MAATTVPWKAYMLAPASKLAVSAVRIEVRWEDNAQPHLPKAPLHLPHPPPRLPEPPNHSRNSPKQFSDPNFLMITYHYVTINRNKPTQPEINRNKPKYIEMN